MQLYIMWYALHIVWRQERVFHTLIASETWSSRQNQTFQPYMCQIFYSRKKFEQFIKNRLWSRPWALRSSRNAFLFEAVSFPVLVVLRIQKHCNFKCLCVSLCACQLQLQWNNHEILFGLIVVYQNSGRNFFIYKASVPPIFVQFIIAFLMW